MTILCYERCRFKCSKKISPAERQSLFNEFYSLDVNGKNMTLFQCIHMREVKIHRKEALKSKTYSYIYSVKLPLREERVCKRALCSIFQVSNRKVEIIQDKIKANEMLPSADRRGRHENGPHKTPDHVFQRI